MVEAEALLEFFNLARERHRIGGIAVEHLDGDRAAVGGTEETINDLQRAFPAVAAVAALGERAPRVAVFGRKSKMRVRARILWGSPSEGYARRSALSATADAAGGVPRSGLGVPGTRAADRFIHDALCLGYGHDVKRG